MANLSGSFRYSPPQAAHKLIKTILSFLPLLLTFLLLSACEKEDTAPAAEPAPQPIKAPLGEPIGNAVSKTIGPEGGSIEMPDQSIRLQVPAGAVAAATEFSIQQVQNSFPGSTAKSFRLLPEGISFAKPILLTYSYEGQELSGTTPDFFYLAYQDQEGYYKLAKNTRLHKASKTLTVETTHFSDWTFFASFRLLADKPLLQTGETARLQVQIFTEIASLGNPDGSGLGLWQPYGSDRTSFDWSVNYGSGSVKATEKGKATYTAPAAAPEQNTAGVSVRLSNFNLIVNDDDPERTETTSDVLILLTELYIQPAQYVNYTVDGEAYNINGDCVTGCFYMEADKFWLKVSLSDNRYLTIDIPGANAAGSYAYGEGTGKAEMILGSGRANEDKRYITEYRPCYQCTMTYSTGAVKITRYGAIGEYVEGEFSATVYYMSGLVNPPGKKIEGKFRIERWR